MSHDFQPVREACDQKLSRATKPPATIFFRNPLTFSNSSGSRFVDGAIPRFFLSVELARFNGIRLALDFGGGRPFLTSHRTERRRSASRRERNTPQQSPSFNQFALLPLLAGVAGLASCGSNTANTSDPYGDVVGESRMAHVSQSIWIPKVRKYDDTLQLKITLPKEYFWAQDSDEGLRGLEFKPIDYRTLKPIDHHEPGMVGITTYSVVPRYRVSDSGILQDYDRYPETGEIRFGLSYRPDPVPGRPEALWKRNYLKPGVSGEEFYIGCTPPIGPGSIIEPTECGMTMMLNSAEMSGRSAGIMVIASVPASKIEDWEEVEAAMRTLLTSNTEWAKADTNERR